MKFKKITELGLQDLHSKHNNLGLNELNNKHAYGSKPIDSIAGTSGIVEHVEGCALLNHNEVVPSDHRAYIVDLNAEEHFQNEMSEWQRINHVQLNPSRRSHRELFVEELEC